MRDKIEQAHRLLAQAGGILATARARSKLSLADLKAVHEKNQAAQDLIQQITEEMHDRSNKRAAQPNSAG